MCACVAVRASDNVKVLCVPACVRVFVAACAALFFLAEGAVHECWVGERELASAYKLFTQQRAPCDKLFSIVAHIIL